MLKTLRDDGFDVTCYERRRQVGGLWAYTDDKTMTTALRCMYVLGGAGGTTSRLSDCSDCRKHQQIYLRHVRLSHA